MHQQTLAVAQYSHKKISSQINSTMPTVTRTLAKGIAPRVRSPKNKKKSALNHSSTKLGPQKNKRKASESDSDNDESLSDSDPKPKQKRKAAKCQRTDEPESEIETVDAAEPEPIVEEVEINPDSDDEVSQTPYRN